MTAKTGPIRVSVFLVCLMLLSACSSTLFRPQNLAKDDIALVADAHIEALNSQVRQLVSKLYKRNPRELAKTPGKTVASRLKMIFSDPATLEFSELQGRESIATLLLCFDESFKGDRVFAMGVGLRGMLYHAYGSHTELFMFEQLDAQKLYNSARNLEIVAWRLSHSAKANGELYLLSNSTNGEINLSFERLLGKMIALQDMMASITADRNRRTINRVIHGIASIVFLPV